MSFTVVSTFSGCGGSCLGYKLAGGKVLLAIEWETNAAETYRLNFPEVDLYHGDICNIKASQILERTNLKKGELDLFDGSPPCQGFSTAGKRKVDDSRNQLFREYCRLLKELQPKTFIMENVSGMIKGQMKFTFVEILKELKSCGYRVKAALLNSMHYGVPQSRQRTIFIGIREDFNLDPTHPTGSNKITTFKEATIGCPDIQDKTFPDWLKKAVKELPSFAGSKKTATAFIRHKGSSGSAISTIILDYNKPSCTITKSEIAAAGLIHPNRQRYLNIHELKRLSTFPDSFIFTSRKEGIERIGNSVPPLFMKSIATHVYNNFISKINGEPFNFPSIKKDYEKAA